jgi:hypothetical protein
MKIEKLLITIERTLLNRPEIDFPTVHQFTTILYECMSEKEKNQFITHIQVIKSLTSKQITIDGFIHNTKIDNLDKQFKKVINNE